MTAQLFHFPVPDDGGLTLDTILADMTAEVLRKRGFQAKADVIGESSKDATAAIRTSALTEQVQAALAEAHTRFCGFLREEMGHRADQLPPRGQLRIAAA